ncbi:hypothetical protein K1719_035080 [Acacia pycnantha]|nr:hypothetical protein K1719_035080 [Acacia pycnantha]
MQTREPLVGNDFGFKASWIWSSIITDREILQKDSQWLMGNVTNDTVDSLIVNGCWNFSTLAGKVTDDITSLIGTINLEYLSHRDKLIWSGARNGIFTVKLGYKHIKAVTKQTITPPNRSFALTEEFWLKLWEIKAPLRILNFIWRCCSKAVPSPTREARVGANGFWSALAHQTLTTEWTAPPIGSLKINCDGSYLAEDLFAAIGVLLPKQPWLQNSVLLFLKDTLELASSRSDLAFSFSLSEGNSASDYLAVSIPRKMCLPLI